MSEIAKRRIIAQEGINYQPTEEAEQTAVIEWATIMEKQFPELALLHHCPNGEARNPIIGAKLKRMGVKAGVPDLFLPVPRGGFHGLWIEMKRRKGGRVSEEQDWWIRELDEQMYRVEVCHGSDEACEVLFEYLTETEQ